MIRTDLRIDGDRCQWCGDALADARHVERVRGRLVYGQHADDEMTVVIATCAGCGIDTAIPWEV